MKLINRLLLFIFATTVFVACDDEDYPILNPSAESVMSLSTSDLLLVEDDADENALTVSWTEPAFGYDAAPTYRVTFTNGEKTNGVDVGNTTSKTFKVAELNSLLLNTGFEGGVPGQVTVGVDVVLSDYKEFASNTSALSVTPYSADLDLSTEWGVVGSAWNNWGADGPDAPFWLTNDPDVIVCYVTLKDGHMKFRPNNDWPGNLGDNDNDGTLEPDGADIPVTAGTYRIQFNIAKNTYEMDLYSWGLVGDATENGWDGPDVKMEYNPLQDTWEAITTLTTGGMKFRLNNDWDAGNYGGADNTLVSGGDNIAVNAGTWKVVMNLGKNSYSLIPN